MENCIHKQAPKNLHMDVSRSFIQNCHNLKSIMVLFRKWMDKLEYIQTMEYYSVVKVSDQAIKRLRENLNAYYCVRKANLKKGYILSDPNYITVWKRHTIWGQFFKKSVAARLGRGKDGWLGTAQIFRILKIFCITPYWWMYVIMMCPNPSTLQY